MYQLPTDTPNMTKLSTRFAVLSLLYLLIMNPLQSDAPKMDAPKMLSSQLLAVRTGTKRGNHGF
jgi:hypothetical protein